jgi:3-oxo-5-alpha-steroid 4-dehydrogenase 1
MNEITVYRILLISVFAFAVLIYFFLLIIPAPYGRHLRRGWGCTIKARAGWFLMEFAALFIIIILFFWGNRKSSPVAITFMLMWSVHYFLKGLSSSLLLLREAKRNSLLF